MKGEKKLHATVKLVVAKMRMCKQRILRLLRLNLGTLITVPECKYLDKTFSQEKLLSYDLTAKKVKAELGNFERQNG